MSYNKALEIYRKTSNDVLFITHNKIIAKKLRLKKLNLILIPSPLPNGMIQKIVSHLYYFLVFIFSRFILKFKKIQLVYSDIQGYAIGEYIFLKNCRRNNISVFDYNNVKLPEYLFCESLISKTLKIYGLNVYVTKHKNEIFYYFKTEFESHYVTLINDGALDNVLFLYTGGVVENDIMNNTDYYNLLYKIHDSFSQIYVKEHPRFTKIKKDYFHKWVFLNENISAEELVGDNCSAIGFQSYALTNNFLNKRVSLLGLLENTDQLSIYLDYLLINGPVIVLDEFEDLKKILI